LISNNQQGFSIKIIVKIDSITLSFCLCHYVQNGLSYSGKETRPSCVLSDAKLRWRQISWNKKKSVVTQNTKRSDVLSQTPMSFSASVIGVGQIYNKITNHKQFFLPKG